jgi:hypothetical protein
MFNDIASSSWFSGNVADVRVMTGSVVPVATFTPQSTPFTTAPTYRTGMDTGYTSNLTLALNSQYFPGASTSPYGPCLTLPGTVGSYYSAVNTAYDTNWKTNGFCLEAWVNYASFANTVVATQGPATIGHMSPITNTQDWSFGATATGQVLFYYYNGTVQSVTSSSTITTGSWNHLMVQSNGTNIWLAVNGTFVSGAGTAISGTPAISAGIPITLGMCKSETGPNFAITKARLTFGTSGSPSLGNVYSSGNFTPSPNFASAPNGASVAWSLDSQYPLPTYPSIQDVTPLPSQLTSYGSIPTPVGGVTSNVLGPYTSSPQLDSIRFDGTGYIDYGNAASSVLTTNIWANAWTIEGWVYPTTATANIVSRSNTSTGYDWSLGINSTSNVFFDSKATAGEVRGATYLAGDGADQGNSVAVDAGGNVYVTGSYTSTTTATLRNMNGTASAYSLPATNSGTTDVFIIKYNSSGSVVAYSYINGTVADSGQSLTVDSSGNLYVTGSYTSTGTVTIRNLDTTASASAYSLPASSGGVPDAFIIKYNSSGSVVAYSYINGTVADSGQSLTVDSSGNLYVTGYYYSGSTVTLRNLDTTASTSAYTLPIVAGQRDAFIVKYNSSGSVVAYSYINGTSLDQGNSLAVDSGGNLYVTGYYQSSSIVTLRNLDTTASTSSYSLPISSAQYGFIVKYNSSGSVLAFSYINGDQNCAGQSLAVDSSGNLYVTGYYGSTGTVTIRNLDTTASTSSYTLPISSGVSSTFILKYNSSGSVVGYSYIIGTGSGTNGAVVADSSGNIYITGTTYSASAPSIRNIDTTASASGYSLPAGSITVCHVIKYNSSGSVTGYSYVSGTSFGYSLTVDSGGNLYVTGYYYSSGIVTVRNLDTTASASAYTLPVGAPSNDAFLIKYNTTGLLTTGPSAPINTWTHVAASYDGSTVWLGAGGRAVPLTPASAPTFVTDYSTQIGGTFSRGQISGNLADVRVSNVARYTGSSYTVPNVADGSAPFVTDRNTLLLLKSLGGQVGTTLQVQGRGLNAVSLGATRSVQSYPPAPMSSYLLDTTSNASVTYGQGKYVASASSEITSSSYTAYQAFDKRIQAAGVAAAGWEWAGGGSYSTSSPYSYTGSVVTVDALGNSYAGEWLQLQMPVSIILSSFTLTASSDSGATQGPANFSILGSRDGINWTRVSSYNASGWGNSTTQTFSSTASQAYNYYRLVVSTLIGGGVCASIMELVLNGLEESLCVTSDAKVGVGIANPQRTLEVAGDLVVGGTISGGAGMGSFRNRIINGDMRIAQRGTSNVISTGAGAQFYMIDRFAFNSNFSTQGLLTQTQQTLTASDTPYQTGLRYSWRITTNTALTAASYGYTEPQQIIEGYNVSDLNWGTSFGSPITVSFWFRTNLAPGLVVSATIRGGAQYAFPFTVTGNGAWQYVTATVPPPPNGGTWGGGNGGGIYLFLGARGLNSYQNPPNTWVATNYSGTSLDCNPYANAGNYIEFTGVQLEKGTVATPFEFRNYATELALCYRYYFRRANETNYDRMGTWSADNSTAGYTQIPLPVRMRAIPTGGVSSSSDFVWGNGTITSLTNDSLDQSSIMGILRVNGTGLTNSGIMYSILASNKTPGTAYIDFNAEL